MEFLKSMSNNVKKNAIMYGFSTDLYEKGNKGDIISGEEYGSLAYSAWDKGIISESTYLTFMEELGIDISKFDYNDEK